jgi:glycosyltransferase involved in cell wall biosynthesis
MRILLIHNRYKQYGGEDAVLKAESAMLAGFGNEVVQMVLDNSVIKTFLDKCLFGLKTIYNPESAHALQTRIAEFSPDVIHVHNFLPLVSPSVFIMARKSGVPVVLSLHNYRMLCPSATLFYNGQIYEKSIHSFFPFDAVWKGVYRNSKVETAIVAIMLLSHRLLGTWKHKVSGYIALSHFGRKKFENSILNIAPYKMFVKSNFVEDCGNGDANRENFFLYVGRLTQEKGIDTLLKAANSHNFKLVIIGDGPMNKCVEDAALQNPNISFLGFQPKPVIISYLKKCKAMIFPSIWYETYPVTILEALSTGTPVIASNLGSMMEMIQNEKTGLHFEPGNEKDLVSKIIKITNEGGFTKSLSDNARKTYLENYTPEKNYSILMNIYNTVIERQRLRIKDIVHPQVHQLAKA